MKRLPTKEALMSWVDEVAERDGLDCRETLLLTKFAAYADADMCSWAKMETLERRARSSERKVRYMLRDFEARGYIRDSGRTHQLESGREVPLYVFCGFLADLEAKATGARRAPVETLGGTGDIATGAQGVPPYNEPIEPTSPVGEGARAQAGEEDGFEAGFAALEAAFPRIGLAATFRDRAKVALRVVLGEGYTVAMLVEAARAYAADGKWKRKDLGLDHWLHDRRFRYWLPQPGLGLDTPGPARAEVPACAADDGATAAWLRTMAEMQVRMGAASFGSWLGRARLEQLSERLFVVVLEPARDWLRANRWREIETAWAAHDARPLTLMSRREFEALMRQGEA